MDTIEALDQSRFAEIIQTMIANSTGSQVVTDKNVFQEGNPANKPLMDKIMRDLMLPGSEVVGFEHLEDLHRLAQKKKPCLLLVEHYSNFDLPCLINLLESRSDEGREIAESIVAVAGVKLNEESKLVLAFTEIFTRVVLYPTRSLESITDPKERHAAEKRRAKLNIAAMKALMKLRKEGRIVLLFPTGTRYRPWDPSTGRGLKEVDTYLKFYSYLVTVAVNGNTLIPNRAGTMDEDFPRRDVMIYTVSPVQKCSDFRREAIRSMHDAEGDSKQHVADRVMAALAALHRETEQRRLAIPGAHPYP